MMAQPMISRIFQQEFYQSEIDANSWKNQTINNDNEMIANKTDILFQ